MNDFSKVKEFRNRVYYDGKSRHSMMTMMMMMMMMMMMIMMMMMMIMMMMMKMMMMMMMMMMMSQCLHRRSYQPHTNIKQFSSTLNILSTLCSCKVD